MDIPISIIIPTFNNPNFLNPCIQSLMTNYSTEGLFNVIIVNNGHKNSCDHIKHPLIKVVTTGANLGWEGGLIEGLKHTDSPFVVFMNDDTFIPPSSREWINTLIRHFRDPKVAAVGPSSNTVMGFQNIFTTTGASVFATMFLIGFCMMVRRSALDEVGGVDPELPGGDDIDLSIRLRKAGYFLYVDREAFVYHHGFQTGTRVYGDHTSKGGWNSYEQWHTTITALIKKHGLKAWYEYIMGASSFDVKKMHVRAAALEDSEGNIVRKYVKGKQILDLGCGASKTVEHAIGIDMIPKGQLIHSLHTKPVSVADVVADITEELPFDDNSIDTIIARHIMEHVIDPIDVLKKWHKVLKKGGRLIVAVPNQGIISSIPMNKEHIHAFIPLSMKNLLEKVGYKVVKQEDPKNYVSFITIAEKV